MASDPCYPSIYPDPSITLNLDKSVNPSSQLQETRNEEQGSVGNDAARHTVTIVPLSFGNAFKN